MANDLVALKKQLSQIKMRNSLRRPSFPDRQRIAPPPHQFALETPPVNVACDTREIREEAEVDETEGENVEDYESYLEVEEVDMHNGLFEFVDDDEEAPRFSCVVFTKAQSKKNTPSSMVAKEKKTKEDSTSEVTWKRIISK
ncbi:hypothetical protein KI387_028778, partial [Taxus chinensis]